MALAVTINGDLFKTRLEALLRTFKGHRNLFGGSSGLALIAGKLEDAVAPVPALQLHLTAFEFPHTLMVLTEDTFMIVANKKKIAHLQQLQKHMKGSALKLQLVTADKADGYAAGLAQAVALLQSTKVDENNTTLVGVSDHKPVGKFADAWAAQVAKAGLKTVKASLGIQRVLGCKDEAAMTSVRHAGILADRLLRKVLFPDVKKAINSEKKIKHSEFSAKVEKSVEAADSLKKLGFNMDPQLVDLHLPAFVQSGGKYTVNLEEAASDDNLLSYDTILAGVGAKVKNYCSVCARTFLIDPTPFQETTYRVLDKAHEELLRALRPGSTIGAAVKTALAVITKAEQKQNVELSPYVSKSFGFGIGVQSQESWLALTANNSTPIKVGMTFAVVSALHRVPLTDAKANPDAAVAKLRKFSLLLADTVIVEAKSNSVTTAKSVKELSEVSFELAKQESEESGEEDSDEDDDGGAGAGGGAGGGAGAGAEEGGRRSRYRSKRLQALQEKDGAVPDSVKRARELRQAELMQRLMDRELKRLAKAATGAADEEEEELDLPIESYRNPAEYPSGANPVQISVDRDHEAVLVPMFGTLVPFHIATIKSVTTSTENRETFLRLNFYNAGQALNRDAAPSMKQAVESYANSMWIKTLSFKSKDSTNLTRQARMIKDMQKRMRDRLRVEKENKDLVAQGDLIRETHRSVPMLKDLTLRPHLSGRRTQGTLAAHVNGVRFTSTKKEYLDVLYSNIRHAFLQPCDKEHVVLIHFHLKNPIIVGKKQHKDITYYTEVVEASQALDSHSRSMYDPDEFEAEARERKLRAQLNQLFHQFAGKIEHVANRNRAPFPQGGFDMPERQYGFFGVAHREMVYLMPTTNCLVALVNSPPFVLTLDDVEHVHCERVDFRAKNFDMVFILKEGKKSPMSKNDNFVRVTSIPRKSLDAIQTWLTDVAEITYTAGTVAYNWKKIIETVVRQPDFWDDVDYDGATKRPGYTFLIEGTVEGEDESNAKSESEYEEDEEEDDYEEEEESDWEEDLVSETEALAEGADVSDDDGVTWDELDRQAAAADRKKKEREEVRGRGRDDRSHKRSRHSRKRDKSSKKKKHKHRR